MEEGKCLSKEFFRALNQDGGIKIVEITDDEKQHISTTKGAIVIYEGNWTQVRGKKRHKSEEEPITSSRDAKGSTQWTLIMEQRSLHKELSIV